MSKYEEIKNELFPNGLPEIVPLQFNWYAYKNGTCSTVATEKEAKQISPCVEKFCINQEESNNAKKAYIEANASVYNKWREAMREEHSHLSQEIFDKCMSEAYDRGHAYGYCEVESHLQSIVTFVDAILDAYKKSC